MDYEIDIPTFRDLVIAWRSDGKPFVISQIDIIRVLTTKTSRDRCQDNNSATSVDAELFVLKHQVRR